MNSSLEIVFGSFLAYAPKGETPNSKRIKGVCLRVKDDGFLIIKDKGRFPAIPTFVELLHSELAQTPFKELLNGGPILVPMPRSAPSKPGSLMPARRICEEMLKFRLGSEMRLLLTRIKAVPKAAFAASSQERPTIQQHIDSMRVESDLLSATTSTPIVVVDDVVTRGTSFIAAIMMVGGRT